MGGEGFSTILGGIAGVVIGMLLFPLALGFDEAQESMGYGHSLLEQDFNWVSASCYCL